DVRRGGPGRRGAEVAQHLGGSRLRPRPRPLLHGAGVDRRRRPRQLGEVHVARNESTRWELVAAVAVGVLRALAPAHRRTGPDGAPLPIIHRDVSPHNVLLTTRGMVKLIDFGLAFAPDRAQETTDPGIVKGKMSYLAPEIVTGGRPSPASDQFACGSVLWE